MASLFGHGIVGFTLARVIDFKNIKWLVAFATGSSILPDLDVITFNFGIAYSHPMGHRGFTHSMVFGLIWALVLMFGMGKRNKVTWLLVIFLSTISHGVLDAMTSGGRGVGFFIPFNNTRFFFPFRKIQVSPIGVEEFFSNWGLKVIYSEFKYVFIPCGIILLILHFIKKKK